MLLSLQLFDESRCFHNRCDNGDKGLKQRLLTFNTRQLFRPIGTRQWYPPHAFGAQGSADHLDWFATTRLPRGLQKRISQKRVEPASGLRPPAFWPPASWFQLIGFMPSLVTGYWPPDYLNRIRTL